MWTTGYIKPAGSALVPVLFFKVCSSCLVPVWIPEAGDGMWCDSRTKFCMFARLAHFFFQPTNVVSLPFFKDPRERWKNKISGRTATSWNPQSSKQGEDCSGISVQSLPSFLCRCHDHICLLLPGILLWSICSIHFLWPFFVFPLSNPCLVLSLKRLWHRK